MTLPSRAKRNRWDDYKPVGEMISTRGGRYCRRWRTHAGHPLVAEHGESALWTIRSALTGAVI